MNLQDHNRQTALHWAISPGETGLVSYLLSLPDKKSSVSGCNEGTSLHYAVEGGRTEIAKMLLQLSSETIHRHKSVVFEKSRIDHRI